MDDERGGMTFPCITPRRIHCYRLPTHPPTFCCITQHCFPGQLCCLHTYIFMLCTQSIVCLFCIACDTAGNGSVWCYKNKVWCST